MLNMPEDYVEAKKTIRPELVELMDKLVLKHASIPRVLNVTYERHTVKNDWVKFYFRDDRFPDKQSVGSVGWDYGTGVNSCEFVVTSRLIQNNKYSYYNKRDHHSVRTKDPRKALKAIMQYVVHFSYSELAMESSVEATKAHGAWVDENSDVIRLLNVNHNVMAEELENLMAQNVSFKTEVFIKAVGALDMYKEYQERRARKAKMVCIMQMGDKLVFMDGGDEKEHLNDSALPESIRAKVGLLKLLDNKKYIPEVGYKFDSNTFWIYTESNN